MKKQQKRGPIPASASSVDHNSESVPAAAQKQVSSSPAASGKQQQRSQQQTGKQNTGKSGKGTRIAVTIKEANPIAVSISSSGYHEGDAAIELLDTKAGKETSGDEWTTVSSRKNKKKSSPGDENLVPGAAASSMDRIIVGVNGIKLATGLTAGSDVPSGNKSKKKKSAANKSDAQPLNQTEKAVTVSRKGSDPKEQSAQKPIKPQPQQQPQQKHQKAAPTAVTESEADGDPVKRLRNLRKRLKEIEELRNKDKNSLGADQIEKMKRYSEIKKQIQRLEAKVSL
jgi:hypothetical protein